MYRLINDHFLVGAEYGSHVSSTQWTELMVEFNINGETHLIDNILDKLYKTIKILILLSINYLPTNKR